MKRLIHTLDKMVCMIPAIGLTVLLVSCSSTEQSPMVAKSEPAADAVLTESPSSLRIFFTEAPDADSSNITMTGPDGEVTMTLLHTMGMNDLMIFINDLPLANGSYTVNWTAPLGERKTEYTGSYSFAVAATE